MDIVFIPDFGAKAGDPAGPLTGQTGAAGGGEGAPEGEGAFPTLLDALLAASFMTPPAGTQPTVTAQGDLATANGGALETTGMMAPEATLDVTADMTLGATVGTTLGAMVADHGAVAGQATPASGAAAEGIVGDGLPAEGLASGHVPGESEATVDAETALSAQSAGQSAGQSAAQFQGAAPEDASAGLGPDVAAPAGDLADTSVAAARDGGAGMSDPGTADLGTDLGADVAADLAPGLAGARGPSAAKPAAAAATAPVTDAVEGAQGAALSTGATASGSASAAPEGVTAPVTMAALARVLAVLETLEQGPPPRTMTVTLPGATPGSEDLRMTVALRSGAVHVQVRGEVPGEALPPWVRDLARELAPALTNRGFEFGSFESGQEDSAGRRWLTRDEDEGLPRTGAPARPLTTTSIPADDAIRL